MNVFFNFLDELKVDPLEARYEKLFIGYSKKYLNYKNDLIKDLVMDLVDVFVESS